MKWILLGLALLGFVFLALGRYVEKSGGSADESLAAVIPYGIGAVLLIGAGLLLIIVIIIKALS